MTDGENRTDTAPTIPAVLHEPAEVDVAVWLDDGGETALAD